MRYDSNQQIIPDLAESFEISTDGLIYTFNLRQGVTFHDGAAFTAKDVDATWKAIMNPDFTAYSQLGWDQITKIDMPDDFTVVMTTTEVYAPFLSYVSDPVSGAIVSAPVFAKGPDYFRGDFGRKPFGTGPFKFDEWKAKEQITLSRYDGYWGTKPKLDQIIYRVNPDDNTAARAAPDRRSATGLQATAPSAPPASMRSSASARSMSTSRPNMAWSHLDLKHVDFLRITKVRQALDYATPTQHIIDTSIRAGSCARLPIKRRSHRSTRRDITPRPYDLEMAKQLLTEAGLTLNGDGVWEGPNPDAIEGHRPEHRSRRTDQRVQDGVLVSDRRLTTQQIAQVITQSWNSIGIKTEAKSEDVSTIWGPDGYQFDPDTMTACHVFLVQQQRSGQCLLLEQQPDPAGSDRRRRQRDRLLLPVQLPGQGRRTDRRRRKETDPDKRKDIYIQLQHLIADETPVSSSGGARTSRPCSPISAASGRARSTASSGTPRSGTSPNSVNRG